MAPSPVQFNFGSKFVERYAVSFVFRTPRKLIIEEISRNGGIIDPYVAATKVSFDTRFKGAPVMGIYLLSNSCPRVMSDNTCI